MHLLTMVGIAVLAAHPKPASGPGVVELKPDALIETSAGKVTRELVVGEDKPARLVLGGEKILYSRDGDLEPTYLLPAIDADGSDAILASVHSDDPTKSDCTKYVFVTVHKDGTSSASDELGDCTDQFKIERKGNAATVQFQGKSWSFENGKVSEVASKPKKKGKKR